MPARPLAEDLLEVHGRAAPPARPRRCAASRCRTRRAPAASRRRGSAGAAGRRGTSRARAGRRSSCRSRRSAGAGTRSSGKLANVTSASGSSWRATSTSSSMNRSTRSRPSQRTTSGGISFTTRQREERGMVAAGAGGLAHGAAAALACPRGSSRKQRCFDQGTSTKTLSRKRVGARRGTSAGGDVVDADGVGAEADDLPEVGFELVLVGQVQRRPRAARRGRR